MKKYNIFLTTLLIILVVVMVGVLGYYLYTLYENYRSNKIADELVEQFNGEVEVSENPEENVEEEDTNIQENPESSQKQTTSKSTTANYNGYKVIGTINIPSLNVKYPIFNVDNTATLNIGTAAIYPMNVEEALNKYGNVVIAGHNYRNRSMFSRLYTLANDTSIFITDSYGKTLEYKVYNNYTANASDFSYATRKIEEGTAEISLSTCTRDPNTRTVIWAKANL